MRHGTQGKDIPDETLVSVCDKTIKPVSKMEATN